MRRTPTAEEVRAGIERAQAIARGERIEAQAEVRQRIEDETRQFLARGGRITHGPYLVKPPTGPKAVDLDVDAQAILRDYKDAA